MLLFLLNNIIHAIPESKHQKNRLSSKKIKFNFFDFISLSINVSGTKIPRKEWRSEKNNTLPELDLQIMQIHGIL